MLFVALGLSYLLGSIPTAYLLVKRAQGIDIRTVGSGNVGATNAMRTAGRAVGIAVFMLDALKGAIPVLLMPRALPADSGAAWMCGLAAVLGHNFPIFLGFKGGKGVATTIGMLLAENAIFGLALVAIWVVIFFATGYVSIASIAAAIALPLLQMAHHDLPHGDHVERLVGLLLALLIVVRHHANIRRLVAGTEPRHKKS